MNVVDIFNRSVIVARPDETVVNAAIRMREFHVGDLVVISDLQERHPVGIVTDRDIVVSGLAQSPDEIGSLLVGDLMTADPVTVRERASLDSALKKMKEHGIRRLPVVNNAGGLEGILTFDDIVEVMSDELVNLTGLVLKEQKRERERRA